MRDRTSGSVWGVAVIAVAVFVLAVLLANLFGSQEIVAATATAVN